MKQVRRFVRLEDLMKSTCRRTGRSTDICLCLACEFCLPPAERWGGKMCNLDAKEYDVPGFPGYTVDDKGIVRLYRYRKVRVVRPYLTASGSKRVNINRWKMGTRHRYGRCVDRLLREAREAECKMRIHNIDIKRGRE